MEKISVDISNYYKYDPEHKNKPTGGGWVETEKGWTKNKDKSKIQDKTNRIETPSQTIYNKLDKLRPYLSKDSDGKFIVEKKDRERIRSISEKANGDKSKAYRYVANMAKAITDPAKAARRGVMAFDAFRGSFGPVSAMNMANIFLTRALELASPDKNPQPPKETPKPAPAPVPAPAPIKKTPSVKPPKFRKMKPILQGSLHYLIKDNNLKRDEVEELAGFKHSIMDHPMMSSAEFKKRIEQGIRLPRNQAQLKAAFIQHMDARNYDSPDAFQKAKERVQKMSVMDFGKLLGAIMAEEEETV